MLWPTHIHGLLQLQSPAGKTHLVYLGQGLLFEALNTSLGVARGDQGQASKAPENRTIWASA